MFNTWITLIEDFSNECFYEIFEYLDGCEIYQAFVSLNHRFQQLINSSLPLFKLNFRSLKYNQIYNDIFVHHKHQIFSFYLSSNEFVSSSFHRLQSLVIGSIRLTVLRSILANLFSLPRLVSLIINAQEALDDLTDAYRLIFTLPKLKYIKCSVDTYTTCDLLPATTDEQFSSIEHLIIYHHCDFDTLCTLVSYTPQLRRLTFFAQIDDDFDIGVTKSLKLSNLTHLYTNINEMSFDKLERFINKFNVKLKVLSLGSMSEDINYLEANRWEEVILKNFTQLEKFYFTYNVYFGDNDEAAMYLGKRDQFSSPFWLERQWILETKILFDTVQYSICPYKKQWYEYDKMIGQLSKSIRLIIEDVSPEKWFKTLSINQYINHILDVTKIYHLEIQEEICTCKLIQILYLLPELDTLRIHSLSFSKLDYLSDEELDDLVVLVNKNQITKVYLEKIPEIEEFHAFILMFSRMNYLQIKCVNYMDTELLVECILTVTKNESTDLLRLLCFSISAADDNMVKKLEHLIIVENLLCNFTIKRMVDNIYVHWK